jgi:hypothetical protein
VAEARSSGEVSKAKAAELVRAADLPEDTQHALVEQARTMPVEHVAAAVEQARLADGLASTPVVPSLTINRRTDRATVEATLDLVDAEMLDVALSTAVESLQLPTTMPYAERRARALGAVARFFLDHQTAVTTGRLGRPHVVVLVDLEVLEARSHAHVRRGHPWRSGPSIGGGREREPGHHIRAERTARRGPRHPVGVTGHRQGGHHPGPVLPVRGLHRTPMGM